MPIPLRFEKWPFSPVSVFTFCVHHASWFVVLSPCFSKMLSNLVFIKRKIRVHPLVLLMKVKMPRVMPSAMASR